MTKGGLDHVSFSLYLHHVPRTFLSIHQSTRLLGDTKRSREDEEVEKEEEVMIKKWIDQECQREQRRF